MIWSWGCQAKCCQMWTNSRRQQKIWMRRVQRTAEDWVLWPGQELDRLPHRKKNKEKRKKSIINERKDFDRTALWKQPMEPGGPVWNWTILSRRISYKVSSVSSNASCMRGLCSGVHNSRWMLCIKDGKMDIIRQCTWNGWKIDIDRWVYFWFYHCFHSLQTFFLCHRLSFYNLLFSRLRTGGLCCCCDFWHDDDPWRFCFSLFCVSYRRCPTTNTFRPPKNSRPKNGSVKLWPDAPSPFFFADDQPVAEPPTSPDDVAPAFVWSTSKQKVQRRRQNKAACFLLLLFFWLANVLFLGRWLTMSVSPRSRNDAPSPVSWPNKMKFKLSPLSYAASTWKTLIYPHSAKKTLPSIRDISNFFLTWHALAFCVLIF